MTGVRYSFFVYVCLIYAYVTHMQASVSEYYMTLVQLCSIVWSFYMLLLF